MAYLGLDALACVRVDVVGRLNGRSGPGGCGSLLSSVITAARVFERHKRDIADVSDR